MADYIDRDKVLEAILALPPKMDEQGYGWLGRMGVWQMLSDFPSAGDSMAEFVEIPETGIGDLSDGYHTFNQLYFQRCILFAQIVNDHKDRAWKTRCHEDGQPCFGGGWFLVTIDTPSGAYGYHFEDRHWDLFDCEELPKAKHWDGYTEKDVMRLFTLPDVKETYVVKLN